MAIILQASDCLLLSTDKKKKESLWRDDSCYKFIFSLKGAMHYQTKRQELTLQENDFMIFNPHTEHKQLAAEDHKFLIELNPVSFNEAAYSITGMTHDMLFAECIQRHPLISQWVQLIQHYIQLEERDGSPASPLFLEHSFAQLFLLLVQAAVGTHTVDRRADPFLSVHPAIARVMKALKDDYQHSWRLDEMAEIIGISKYQFAHLFKQVTGVSPFSWLQLYRIIRSQDLLLHTNKNITEIAVSCGFSSMAVYNQLFKRLYGFSPRMFRKSLTGKVNG